MKGTGLFFLTSRPSLVHLESPATGDEPAWLLPLLERTKRGTQHVRAFWRGPDAATFVRIHAARLKSGQALNVELERVTPDDDGLKGFVITCSLAPDRWPTYHVEPALDAAHQQRPQAA
jgi:hypothetical protein